MLKSLMNFYADVQEGYLSVNDVIFLQSINSKQEEINKEIEEIDSKKDRILKKIDEDEKILTKNTKEYREYTENTESILECLKAIVKNLADLKKELVIVELKLEKIVEKYKANNSMDKLQYELDDLKLSIDNTSSLEMQVKNDNEKNYLIIDGFKQGLFSNNNLAVNDKIEFYDLNEENLQDNPVLKICEKRVELPYTKKEIQEFMKKYPNEYKTIQDVIIKEFMVNIDLFKKHPIFARFKEAYYLCRTKEMMSIFDSFNFAKNIMFRSDINPYIVAAVKSKRQLEDYIKCLEENRLDDYPHFKIIYEINPLTI